MSVYLIADIEVTDPAAYEDYKRLSGPSLQKYGGRFLVRGGPAELLEGERAPQRTILIEFDDMAQFRRWWSSSEYEAAKKIRHRTANSHMLVVEGA